MNSFRSLLQDINSREGIEVYDKMMDEDEATIVGNVNKVSSDIQCFWLGDGDQYTDVSILNELIHLPFKRCWFEWDWRNDKNGYWIVALLCYELSDGSIEIIIFRRKNEKWLLQGSIRLDKGFSQGSTVYTSEVSGISPEESKLFFSGIIGMLKGVLTILNCSNVSRIQTHPDKKLQDAARKNGRLPFYSYWTLSIGGERMTGKDNRNEKGHQSPRHHVRRGHARQYAPGKYTWVSPCMVGNKDLGEVQKDYSVKVVK